VKLKAAVFISGMAVMIIEILGSRLIAPYFGNSIFVWTSIIGVVLASLSLGYYFGGRLADKEPSIEKLSQILLYAGLAVCFIPAISTPILLLSTLFGLKFGSITASLILLSIPSILLGVVSPYAVKLETKKLGVLGKTAGNLYAISTFGSIIGTFLTGFVLIPLIGVKSILYLVALLLFSASIILSIQNKIKVLASIGIMVMIIIYIAPKSEALDSAGLVYSHDTPYYHITVRDGEKWGRNLRNLHLDIGLQGGMFLDTNESIYPYSYFFQVPFTLREDIRDVLSLGTGAGITQSSLIKHYPDVRVDTVDIDSEVARVASEYFGFVESEKLRFYLDDARFFLTNSQKKYDLIILDAFTSDPSTPPHLTTTEMLGGIKDHLNEEGIFAANVIASIDGQYSHFFKNFAKTCRGQFSCVHILPMSGELEELQNIIIIGMDSSECIGKEDLRILLRTLPENPIVDWKTYSANLMFDDLNLTGASVLTDDYAPVEYLQMKASEKVVQRYYQY